MMGNIGSHSINYSLYKKLPYTPDDFSAITLVISNPNILVVNSSTPFTNVQQLVTAIKLDPSQYSFGSAGTGQSPHLSGEMFMQRVGIQVPHIPYKGAGPSTGALLGNQFTFMIATAPSVIYKLKLRDENDIELHNPADMPDIMKILEIEEPWIRATILTPDEYLGSVLKLCQDRRGTQIDLNYVGKRAMVVYDLPLNEVVFDFYDRLKSISKGYASFDYNITDYRAGDLVKMSLLVNAEPVDALSMLVHRTRAEMRGRAMCEKLKELIPQHLFQIPIQAAIGGKIIARETISALRKDVTAKCYGGDISRKRKLLDKQKEGKKRMRQFGRVEIPQEAFIAALKMDS